MIMIMIMTMIIIIINIITGSTLNKTGHTNVM